MFLIILGQITFFENILSTGRTKDQLEESRGKVISLHRPQTLKKDIMRIKKDHR